jgi:transposase-like protein
VERAGWSTRQAARVLDVDPERVRRWRRRRRHGAGLVDARPGGAVHGILPAERDAILTLVDACEAVDRSHRKLAHRGSRLNLVHVSESTVLRVLTSEGLVLPGHGPREPAVAAPWPDRPGGHSAHRFQPSA